MIDRTDIALNRRSLLKAAGAAAAAVSIPGRLLGAPESAAGSGDLRAKAKKNLKLGIFTGVYGGLPLNEAARRIREDGFGCVVLQYSFKDVKFDPFAPDWDELKKITTALEKNDIQVVGLYGYHNVIGPDEVARKRNEQFTGVLIDNWQRFGSPIISTETGTFNAQSQFAEDPRNFTEEGYAAAREAFAKLVRRAEKTKAVIAIETYWKNLIDSIDRTERLFRDIDSPSLKLTMDPCNYYKPDELPRMDEMLRDMFKRVGTQTVLAHAKDIRQTDKGQEHPAAGLGVLNYPLYLRLMAKLDREIPMVIEHLALGDVHRARDYVKAQFDKI
jgi:sugar phosphate isomerase/epimerase